MIPTVPTRRLAIQQAKQRPGPRVSALADLPRDSAPRIRMMEAIRIRCTVAGHMLGATELQRMAQAMRLESIEELIRAQFGLSVTQPELRPKCPAAPVTNHPTCPTWPNRYRLHAALGLGRAWGYFLGNGAPGGTSKGRAGAPHLFNSMRGGVLVPVGEAASFELKNVVSGGTHTFVLTGEVDMLAAPQLDEAIRRLCVEGTSEIVLDLRKVTFMDSTGLRAIVATQQTCAQAQLGFSVIPGPPQLQRLFEIAGLLDHLPLREPS